MSRSKTLLGTAPDERGPRSKLSRWPRICSTTVHSPSSFSARACVVQSNLSRLVPMTTSSESITRVLLIEPDAARAVIFQTVLRPRLDAHLVVVKGIEEAIRSIATEIPDLVLTSIFLTPADEATLTARLKEIPDAAHVQVVNAPYFPDVNGESPDDSTRSKLMKFLRLRSTAI